MFIRKKLLYGDKIAVQICEGHREDGTVRQRVLRHVGTTNRSDTETLEKLIQASMFIKNELEVERKNKALSIEPDLPFKIPGQQSAPLKESAEPLAVDKEEHHWLDTAKLSEESRVVEGLHAVFGSALDKFGLQSLGKATVFL